MDEQSLPNIETKVVDNKGTDNSSALLTQIGALQQQLSSIAAEKAALASQLSTTSSELEQWKGKYQGVESEANQVKTSYSDITSQFHQTTQELAKNKQELTLFGIIASNPEYHALLPVANAIRRVDSPEEQAQIVADMAKLTTHVKERTIQALQSGDTSAVITKPQQTPKVEGKYKTAQEAWRASIALARTNPREADVALNEYRALTAQ